MHCEVVYSALRSLTEFLSLVDQLVSYLCIIIVICMHTAKNFTAMTFNAGPGQSPVVLIEQKSRKRPLRSCNRRFVDKARVSCCVVIPSLFILLRV